MEINQFLNDGIKDIASAVKHFYLKNSTGRKFILKIAREFRKDAGIRGSFEADGIHIPPFLIASIASECNLFCPGCYARANGGCNEKAGSKQMAASEWRRIFKQASEIGVSFVLLAGGEPLLRREVIETAAETDDILFPVFTNGTMLDEEYIKFFARHRNLIPILSIEGDEKQTDARRGKGMSDILNNTAERLQKNGILYGVSITVTTENYNGVTETEFVNSLRAKGCGIIFYVEYVPVESNTQHLVLTGNQLQFLQTRIGTLRKDKKNKKIIILSFPGDEQRLGGCLAAGRGFFHISVSGNAEPCPFSPFSAVDLKQQSMLDALRSPFFEKVREISAREAANHNGGCTLYQYEDEVRKTLELTAKNN